MENERVENFDKSIVQEKRKDCTICKKVFKRPYLLKKHVESVHEGIRPFKCESCDAKFSYERDKKNHISSVHKGEKPFNCGFCDKNFATINGLKGHISTTHEEKQCKICKRKFSDKGKVFSFTVKLLSSKVSFGCYLSII